MDGQNIVRALPLALAADPIERLSSLFEEHYDRLYRLARHLTGTADDALDLVQETFLRAARAPRSIPFGHSNEEAWLVRVLINVRRDQWRKTAVRDRHDQTCSKGGFQEGASKNPEASIIAKAEVWRALNVLPPRRRAVLVLFELEGLPVPQIASLLGLSAITVRWHLSMGRRELRRALAPDFGGRK